MTETINDFKIQNVATKKVIIRFDNINIVVIKLKTVHVFHRISTIFAVPCQIYFINHTQFVSLTDINTL